MCFTIFRTFLNNMHLISTLPQWNFLSLLLKFHHSYYARPTLSTYFKSFLRNSDILYFLSLIADNIYHQKKLAIHFSISRKEKSNHWNNLVPWTIQNNASNQTGKSLHPKELQIVKDDFCMKIGFYRWSKGSFPLITGVTLEILKWNFLNHGNIGIDIPILFKWQELWKKWRKYDSNQPSIGW